MDRKIFGNSRTWLIALVSVMALVLGAVVPAAAYERRTPVVEAIEKAGPAVVNIRTEQIVKRRRTTPFGFGDSLFEEFFGRFAPPRTYRTQSLGSGVIIDPRGYVLTNAHVIAQASKILVAVPGEPRELEAQLVGADERLDLAVLRLQAKRSFPFLEPVGSADLMLGETVIAIGNPLGLGHSVTTGVVSAASRRVTMGDGRVAHFIQSDALINPGNSGGPLLNINGRLIGINTAIAQQAQGIGFAIPMDMASRVAGDLIEHGRRRPVWLGIRPGEVNAALVRERGAGGVLVVTVERGSPASAAGVKAADVVLGVDGLPVESSGELLTLLASYTPEDEVRLRVLRGTEERKVEVSLAPLPENYGLDYARRVFGFTVRDARHGVVVAEVEPDSPATRVGLRPGDRIAEVGGRRLAHASGLGRYLVDHRWDLPQEFLFVRDNRGYYVEMP